MLNLHYNHIFNLRILLECDVKLDRKMIKKTFCQRIVVSFLLYLFLIKKL